jgi:hypothetical protein
MKLKKIFVLLKIIGWMLYLLFIPIFYYALLNPVKFYQNITISHNQVTEGEVVEQRGNIRIIRFQASGQEIEGIPQGGMGRYQVRNNKVVVNYNQANPSSFYLNDEKLFHVIIHLLFYIVLPYMYVGLFKKIRGYYYDYKAM